MSYIEIYPIREPVCWTDYDRSYSQSESDTHSRSYHSNAVVLHVSMCCDKCVRKVRKSLKHVGDVDSVDVDIRRQRVIVRGHVSPDKVLRKVLKHNKTATFWDSSDDYVNFGSEVYGYYRPTLSIYDYNFGGGRSLTHDNGSYSTGGHDYTRPTSSSDDYDHYGRNPTFESGDTYAMSPAYSLHHHSDRYPSSSEYHRHNNYCTYKSYDAYRYR